MLDVTLESKTKIVIAGDWNACVSQAQDDDDDSRFAHVHHRRGTHCDKRSKVSSK